MWWPYHTASPLGGAARPFALLLCLRAEMCHWQACSCLPPLTPPHADATVPACARAPSLHCRMVCGFPAPPSDVKSTPSRINSCPSTAVWQHIHDRSVHAPAASWHFHVATWACLFACPLRTSAAVLRGEQACLGTCFIPGPSCCIQGWQMVAQIGIFAYLPFSSSAM